VIIVSQEKSIVKYLVKLKFDVEGVVEKADLVGAIFGQTEGLFGPEMNLQELQKTWKVGRIEITLQSNNGRTTGEVLIPMSTDVQTAALIAAAVENVDKVGPCSAKFTLVGISDVRAERKKVIVDRAKAIMKEWASKTASEGEESLKDIGESVKRGRVISYGREGLPAGPAVSDSDTIIVVEGRADVINLLRAGIENTIAVEGTSIPETVKELAKRKRVYAFLDGDRGGDLILKELSQVARVDRVFRAPRGREVEELTPIEILEILREPRGGGEILEEPQVIYEHSERGGRHDRTNRERNSGRYSAGRRGDKRHSRGERAESYERYEEREAAPPRSFDEDSGISRREEEETQAEQQLLPPPPPLSPEISEKVKIDYPSVNGTLEAVVYDSGLNQLARMPVNELVSKLDQTQGAKVVVFDGIVTQRLVDASSKAGVSSLVGHRTAEIHNKPDDLAIYSFKDLGLE
jgi:DNA primase